jgi:hypothetical protein
MMDPVEVARLEETRVMNAVSQLSAEWRPWAGGRMCRGAPGLWCNVALGAGFGVEVSDAEVAELVEYYSIAGIEPRVEMSEMASESLRAALERAGFVLRMFEMVLVRELTPGTCVEPVYAAPSAVRFEIIDPTDEGVLRACAEVVIPGFKSDLGFDNTISDDEFDFFKVNARHPRCMTVAARSTEPTDMGPPGRIVAVGGCSAEGHVGALFGAVTVKDQRRRGIQQSLLAFRLNEMARRGVQLATIGSRPHSPTQRNVRRMGFWHAYTKVALVKPGPGLLPVTG